MTRHTTFRFCLSPTAEQQGVLARHAGAARFAFNQCLGMVKTTLAQSQSSPATSVPWTPFDLINAFNAWKRTAEAGRRFVVSPSGAIEMETTGLSWRHEVYQQVFEEAATDCGRALSAWSDSRRGKRRGHRVGFPCFKKKASAIPSFRMRNKKSSRGDPLIQVGTGGLHRSVRLPGVGTIRVHDDTRRLRRMVANGRARILYAAVTFRGGQWWISLTVEAAELHPARRHPTPAYGDSREWVGIDRGLSTFVVAATADGREVARFADAPMPLTVRVRRLGHLNNSLSRKKKGSRNRQKAATRCSKLHMRIARIRRHFLHTVSNQLVKTHNLLVIEDLNVVGMMANHRLARAISDAGWAEFARQLQYKTGWHNGEIARANRWYPSSQICSRCKTRNRLMPLSERTFKCPCGHTADRDLNAAVNLAQWATERQSEPRTPKQEAGPPMPVDRLAQTGIVGLSAAQLG